MIPGVDCFQFACLGQGPLRVSDCDEICRVPVQDSSRPWKEARQSRTRAQMTSREVRPQIIPVSRVQ